MLYLDTDFGLIGSPRDVTVQLETTAADVIFAIKSKKLYANVRLIKFVPDVEIVF